MIIIDKKDKEPLYMQIYTQMKAEILTGALAEG